MRAGFLHDTSFLSHSFITCFYHTTWGLKISRLSALIGVTNKTGIKPNQMVSETEGLYNTGQEADELNIWR